MFMVDGSNAQELLFDWTTFKNSLAFLMFPHDTQGMTDFMEISNIATVLYSVVDPLQNCDCTMFLS